MPHLQTCLWFSFITLALAAYSTIKGHWMWRKEVDCFIHFRTHPLLRISVNRSTWSTGKEKAGDVPIGRCFQPQKIYRLRKLERLPLGKITTGWLLRIAPIFFVASLCSLTFIPSFAGVYLPIFQSTRKVLRRPPLDHQKWHEQVRMRSNTLGPGSWQSTPRSS